MKPLLIIVTRKNDELKFTTKITFAALFLPRTDSDGKLTLGHHVRADLK
jgi:hypothetical protein